MEHCKISKLSNDWTVSKFVKKKIWAEVNHLSDGQCFVNKNLRFKSSMLSSYLLFICGYSDTCIAGTIKGTINRRTGANNHIDQKNVVPKKMHDLGHG